MPVCFSVQPSQNKKGYACSPLRITCISLFVLSNVNNLKILLTNASTRGRLYVSTTIRRKEFVMNEMRLGVIESRFADIVWQRAPLSTAELIKICAAEFDWKRTTTYTVLKRLSERGIFKNDNGRA